MTRLRARRRTVGLALLVALVASRTLEAQPRDAGLIDAVRRRDEQTVLALHRAKADVNQTQPDGATALAWAVFLGERRIAEALLDAGARVNVADRMATPKAQAELEEFREKFGRPAQATLLYHWAAALHRRHALRRAGARRPATH